MITHSLIQGSPEWHAYRANHFNASDAAAMLGISPYKSRTKLLHEISTGIYEEVDSSTQSRFDSGHEAEAKARPLAEETIGEQLYPVVGSLGKLSASFDGLTADDLTAWEHKLLNDKLRDSLGHGIIPDHYHPQMEQQLMVSGSEKVLFMATLWNGDDLVEKYEIWYTSNPELRQQIIAGWAQFEIDLAAYVPSEVVIKPAANAVISLPSVSVQVSGFITIIDNFPAYEVVLRDFIDHHLIRSPVTDQDFADLEVQIKELKKSEVALDAAEAQMLSQVESVDAAKRMKDMLKSLASKNRIMAEKLLAAKKDTIRAEAVLGGRNDLADHIAALNTRIGKPLMPAIPHDFAAAIKGLRTIESLRNSISTELARAKIEANAVADRITINLSKINEKPELAFLFADVEKLVLRDSDMLDAVVKNRITEHQAKEADRIEAERQRIEEQERAKAQASESIRADAEIAVAAEKAAEESKAQAQTNEMAMQEIQGIQHQVYIAQAGRAGVRNGGTLECIKETLAETESWVIDERFGFLQGTAQNAKDTAVAQIKKLLEGKASQLAGADPETRRAAQEAQFEALEKSETKRLANLNSAMVVEVVDPVVVCPPSLPTLRLGQICERLGFNITADFLERLGFKPAKSEGAAKLYHERDFTAMCDALIHHIKNVQFAAAPKKST